MASRGSENDYALCSVCVDGGQNTIARHYCLQCEDFYCNSCVKSHRTIKLLKTHQIKDVNYPDSFSVGGDSSVSGSDEVLGLKCILHQDKVIDSFCRDHDDVCCGACVVVKHGSCSTVSIDIASKHYKSSKEMKTYRDKLAKNLVQFKQEHEKRSNTRKIIDREKLELIENVDKHEEKLIARIKELAEVTRQEIRSKHKGDKTSLDKDIATLHVAIATNTDFVKKLDSADDEEMFVLVKMNCKTVIKDGEVLLETITKDWAVKCCKFQFNQTLENCMTEMTSLGHLEDGVAKDMDVRDVNEYQATFQSNVYVKGNQDRDSALFDMCLFDSNTILVIDYANKKLKRLDSGLQLKDEILLSGKPLAVCKLDGQQVAVRISTSEVIQVVSVGETMKCTSSITVAGLGDGMTYSAGTEEIYACEYSKVSVYSKTGKKLKTFDKNANGEKIFSALIQITLSENQQDIYVTDEKNGLLVLDAKNGLLKMKVVASGVSEAWPICMLPGGICLVGDYSSGKIAQIDSKGKVIGNLITSNNGRIYTYCAVYDRERGRLLVGGRPNVISIYTLSAK